MRRQHTPPDAYPRPVLADVVRALGGPGSTGPAQAALHTRSADLRAALAAAAGAGVDDLIATARAGGTAPGVDPWWLGELARVLAGQDLHPDDRADALALCELLLRTAGPRGVAPAHRGLHAQLAYALGDHGRARALLAGPGLPAGVRAALAADLATDRPAAVAALLPEPAFTLGDGDGPPFDRIRSAAVPRTGSPHRISAVVTAYRPGAALLTTVRSLAAQSWTNLEILVVDDGSGPQADAVLAAAQALDPRVRVLRVPVNGGTYHARNVALDAATGEFVTFQDSDDWSHPLRLERQVAPLLAGAGPVATTSAGIRVTEDLTVTRPGFADVRSYNLSSLMVRREAVLARLGYLDPVRKGADAEYVERARAVFGRPAVRHLGGEPLALIRLSAGSLSGGEQAAGWIHPARRAYLSAFQRWHADVAAGRADAYRPRWPRQRVFAAPRRLAGDAARRPDGYDVVLAGDWSSGGAAAAAGAGQLRALAGRGLAVALLHLDDPARPPAGGRGLDPAVQQAVNAGRLAQLVPGDGVSARLVVVRGAQVLHFAPDAPALPARRVVVEAPAGTGWSPEVCTAAARRLFGAEPLLAPAGPAQRRLLAAGPLGAALTATDLPGSVDPARWRLARPGPRADRPVVGRAGAGGDEWRRLHAALGAAGGLDVRLLGAAGGAREAFGRAGAPRTWLVYEPADLDLRAFLHQVDFYLHLPAGPAGDADPALLAALAAGCVLVLPHRYAPVFGAAAVYAEPAELRGAVRRLHAAPQRFRAQSARGPAFVRARHGHDRYADRVAALLPG